jgi:tRNA(Met) cytidine acetyltransferase
MTEAETPRRWRRLVLLCGEPADTGRWLSDALAGHDATELLWIGDAAPPPVQATRPAHVLRHLGRETRLVVFDLYAGLDPDALAAAAGTLRGGGDCVLLCPPLADWPAFTDPYAARIATYPLQAADLRRAFLGRLAEHWRDDPRIVTWREPEEVLPRLAPPLEQGDPLRLSAAQAEVAECIVRVARGHARRPLVLTADRGRGKSTVLGVAAARLIREGLPRITVVAPRPAAAATLFRHASEQLGVEWDGRGDLVTPQGRLCFRVPQQCLADQAEPPGLVMVDEAAALSVGVLRDLLGVANRLVFATTEHGYEGSGRGFALRFDRLLRETMPQFRRVRLDAPIRWAVDDPLEQVLDRALLLSAEAAPPAGLATTLRVDHLPVAELLGNERLLEAVFGLLVTAHYQTRPSDLRRLLDDPQLELWLAYRGELPVAVLLGGVEGGFDDAMSEAILLGRRRPHGHLLAQSLAVHAGLDDALARRVLRVMRVAVHPQAQRQGIGSRLVNAAAQWAESEGLDAVGCAYGVDEPLLRFWSALGLQPMRLGVRVDPASAAHTLFMVRGLSAAGRRLVDRGSRQFRRDLPWALADVHSDLPPALAAPLLRGRDCDDLRLDAADWRVIERLADRARDPATAPGPLWRWLVCRAARCDSVELSPLVARWLQHWPPERVCRAFGLAGGAALHAQLRRVLAADLRETGEHG